MRHGYIRTLSVGIKNACKMQFAFYIIFASLIVCKIKAGRPEFPEDMKDIIMHVHNTCVGNTGVSEEDISNCEHGKFPDDRKLKCYMFCLMEEASFVDDDGVIDYDMLISMIPDEWRDKVGSMINSCRHFGEDKCDRAFAVHKCLYKTDPELYFLF